MKTFYSKITHPIFLKLVELLGEKSDFVLNNHSFSCDTDRTDNALTSHIVELSKTIQSIADIIGCDTKELNMTFDFEQSDHEMTTHQIEMNPKYVVIGSYQMVGNKLCEIMEIDSDIDSDSYLVKFMNGKTENVPFVHLKSARWDDVFIQRDNMDVVDVY